jgi:RTX calcium-binding nonapeptide repeat (4 copies)
MPTAKPFLAQLLAPLGGPGAQPDLVSRAISALYGNVGANLDERNWTVIMASPDPLSAAEAALKAQWQDPAYLLRNASHLLQQGYRDFSAEITYRQMADRLGFRYDPSWSKGTAFEPTSAATNVELNSRAEAHYQYTESIAPATFSFVSSATGASVTFSHGGRLTWATSGAASDVAAGSLALTPAAAGGVVREGPLTLTRGSGVASTSSTYVVVGTDTALTRNFNAEGTPQFNRLISLGSGDDDVRAGAGADTVIGGPGEDTILGNMGEDVLYGGADDDRIEGGQGNDTIEGGAGNDMLWGGSTGADLLTGGLGADQFRFETGNRAVIARDFRPAEGDKLVLADGLGAGRVNFVTVTNSGTRSAALVPADFDKVATVSQVRSDVGGADAGNDQVYVITAAQNSEEIAAAVTNGARNAYVVVFDSSDGRAKLYFDTDWSDPDNRVEVASLPEVTAEQVSALSAADFMAWLPAG